MNDEPVDIESVYADLGGIHEVCRELGVGEARVRRWIERRDSTNCPRPVRQLRRVHLYSLRQWRAWFALWKVTRGSETWQRKSADEVAVTERLPVQ